jgi:hypothetical protein
MSATSLIGAILVLLLLVAMPAFYIESFRSGHGGGHGGHGSGHGGHGGGHHGHPGGYHGYYRGGYSYLGGGGSGGEWLPYDWFYPVVDCYAENPWSCIF